MLAWRYGSPPSDQITTTVWKRGSPVWLSDDSSGSDTTVIAQDAALAWTSDSVTLAQDHVVGAQDATFAMASDAVAISLDDVLGVQDVTIGGTAYTPAQVAVAVWAYVLPASPLTPSSPYAIEDYAAAVWETVTT